jgi:succinate-semialdehyde dehydrogenase/glutarate-semialdehyde dehydrogenase
MQVGRAQEAEPPASKNRGMPYATVNPATGKTEKTFPNHTPEEVDALLDRAVAAFADYRRTSYADRARHLVTVAELMEGEVPDIASVLTTEMGKTFAAAKGEVSKCAMGLRWFAEHSESLLADEPIVTAASTSYVHYQPIGAVLAIMPWNFPMWQVFRFAAPALMVGNVGLLKHASNVPQTALLIEDLFRRGGLPEGVFTNLFVESKDVAALIEDPRVAAVTLTGSERAGMSVASTAGHALKKSVLELGGSDPFVVLESADLEATVRTAVTARVQNNGQSCIAAKRFIVVDAIADEFLQKFTAAMDALVVGDPFDPATQVGPIVTEAQRDELVAQIEDARSQGATVHDGAKIPDGDGWYLAPTVLSGITPDMRVAQQELFGPVAMVQRVPDLTAALEVANATTFGLGSSVWSSDDEEVRRCIEELEAGAVFVNAMVASTPELPFGGIKRSGFGRELSELGLKEFCNAKTVWIT